MIQIGPVTAEILLPKSLCGRSTAYMVKIHSLYGWCAKSFSCLTQLKVMLGWVELGFWQFCSVTFHNTCPHCSSILYQRNLFAYSVKQILPFSFISTVSNAYFFSLKNIRKVANIRPHFNEIVFTNSSPLGRFVEIWVLFW